MIQGKYAANDIADGAVTIKAIEINGRNMNISFSNYIDLRLEITQINDSFTMNGTKSCIAWYRGHSWQKKYDVTISDICMDDNQNPFSLKVSSNITLMDCEKQVLNFNCTDLKVWNFWDFSRNRYGQIVKHPE